MTTTILASAAAQATSLSLCGGQPRSWVVPCRRAPGAAWLCAGAAAGYWVPHNLRVPHNHTAILFHMQACIATNVANSPTPAVCLLV